MQFNHSQFEGKPQHSFDARTKARDMEILAKNQEKDALGKFLDELSLHPERFKQLDFELNKRGVDLSQEKLPQAEFILNKKHEVTEIVFVSPWAEDDWHVQSWTRNAKTKKWEYRQDMSSDKPQPDYWKQIVHGATLLRDFFVGSDLSGNPEKGPFVAKQLTYMAKYAGKK